MGGVAMKGCDNCLHGKKDWQKEEPCVTCLKGSAMSGYQPISSLEKQVAGSHYKSLKIQPVEFIHANEIGFIAGNVIKYVCRYKAKNGVQDLEKAKHYIEMLIEQETKERK